MLVPEGYALFKSVESSLQDAVATALPFADIMSNEQLCVERHDLTNACWGEFFRKCTSLSLISPAGSVYRVQSEVGRRGRDGEVPFYWLFLDPNVWAVETQKVAERRKNAFFVFHSFLMGKEDAEIEEEFLQLLSSDNASGWSYEGFILQLDKYQGWSISCKDADVPIGAQYFDCLASLVIPAPLKFEEQARKGAPRHKRDSAIEALQNIYPDGVVPDSQKVVLAKVLSFGVKVDPRTLRRALADFAEKKTAE